MSTEISILLNQRVEAAMGQFTQQYREATAEMPIVYHTILRTDYHDNADAAFYKVQGKIALFRTMQAQTPPKAALKATSKVTYAISFVNDIPGMYAGGIAYPARDPIPNLTQEEVQENYNFFKQCQNCVTTAPTFEQDNQQQVLDAISKMVLTADESFGHSKHVLIIGVAQWTAEDDSSRNDTDTKQMLEHIIARMAYQNESPD